MGSASAPLASLALALLAAAPAAAQGDRVHLLGRFNAYDGGGSSGFDYNDVFGFTTSDGREVAILGCWNGTSFIETTDPFNPVEIAFIARNGSLWSDMAVHGSHVYVVTEAGGGMQIIDVSDLANIHLVTTDASAFSHAHSLWIDTTRGHAYACGTEVGMPILDLATPTAPSLITTYTDQYVHEATAQNGLAHFSEIYAGLFRLVDVSALPTITTLDSVATPAAFTHSTTVDDADALVAITDEVAGAKAAFYDITDPSNIVLRSTFLENRAGILHNVFLARGIAEFSAYAEGYVAVDVRDPDRPVRLGSYDTWSGASGGYNGAWGLYPQPSGIVYLSNIEDGLWVLCRESFLDHAPLPDTLDDVGPYVVTTTITPSAAGGGIGAAELVYSTDDGATATCVPLSPTGNPGEWSASIPGVPRGTTVHYWMTATDGLGTSRAPPMADDRFVFSVGERTSLHAESFDGSTDGGWTHGALSGSDEWQRGVPARRVQDPYRTTSGDQCFGTDLGNGSDGLYANSSNSWLESPAVDLTGRHGVRLRFERWLRVNDSAQDVARILVNGSEVWRNPTSGGTLATLDVEWATIDLDVSALADGVAATRVRFELATDASGRQGGWNVDDFELYQVSNCRDSESYGNGAAGSGGFVPTLVTNGDPRIGGAPFGLDAADLLGGSSGLLLVGFARAQLPYLGIDILVSLKPPRLFLPVVAGGPAGVPGAGTFSLSDSLPDDPAIDGLEVDTQVIMFDAGAAQGLSASAGRAFWICH